MLGPKLRAWRQAERMTIAEFASRTGFSPSYISCIERGIVNPSLAALLKISSSIGLEPGYLFEGYNERSTAPSVVKRGERLTLLNPKTPFRYELLNTDLSYKKIEFLRIVMPVGSESAHDAIMHEGEEHAFVVKGRVECVIDGKGFILEPCWLCYIRTHPYLRSLLHEASYISY